MAVKSMLDLINTLVDIESLSTAISYDEWCDIRRNGSPEEIADAIERIEAAGGYDNLE